MNRFFLPSSALEGNRLRLTGDNAHHAKNVLRLKEGEEVSVILEGDTENEYRCGILGFEGDEGLLELRFKKPLSCELPVRVTVCQALPKADKLELVVQKAVELGAVTIQPVVTRRCVADWSGKSDKKLLRLNRIAQSAAEQSGRALIPEVLPPLPLREALEQAEKRGRILFPYEMAEGMEKTRSLLGSIQKGEELFIFIGPEGGFTEEEVSLALSHGAQVITLGKRILRTETAALYLLSVLGFLLE